MHIIDGQSKKICALKHAKEERLQYAGPCNTHSRHLYTLSGDKIIDPKGMVLIVIHHLNTYDAPLSVAA